MSHPSTADRPTGTERALGPARAGPTGDPRDEALLWQRARHHAEAARGHLLELGRVLADLKALTPHGQWQTRLAHNGIGPRWAQYAMRIARVTDDLGVEAAPRLTARQQKTLTRICDDELEALTDEEKASPSLLAERLREAEAERDRLRDQRESNAAAAEALERENADLRADRTCGEVSKTAADGLAEDERRLAARVKQFEAVRGRLPGSEIQRLLLLADLAMASLERISMALQNEDGGVSADVDGHASN